MSDNFDKIICVTNRKLCSIPLEEQLAFLAKKGISRVILREKDLPEEEYAALAKKALGVPKIELYPQFPECRAGAFVEENSSSARETHAGNLRGI